MLKLITTENCSECNMVKRLISSQNLNIEIEKTNEMYQDLFIKAGIRSYPVLIKELEGDFKGFTIVNHGKVGEYIATNLDSFKN